MNRARLLLFAAFLSLQVHLPAADAPATFTVNALSFTRPTEWRWIEPSSSMRKAQLSIPGAAGQEASEVVFFHFGPNNGGGTQANIDRWYGQFSEPREKIGARSEAVEVGGVKVTYVHAQGTYKSGMPGGPQTPKADFALLGAIVEAPGGHIFARLTGPKAHIAKLAPDFKRMIESGLKK